MAMTTGARRPSSGYLVCLGFGMPGIFFADVAVDGVMRLNAGSDSTYPLDHSGIVAMIVAYAIVFASRLIFRPKVAPGTQALLRGVLQAIIVVVAAASVAAAVFVFTRPLGDTMTSVFAGLAVVTQIASLVWLIRYRCE